jgi:hypothetical protein
MNENVKIGSSRWDALQSILDEHKDCIDRIDLREAIVYDARIYRKPTPIWQDDLTGESYVPLSAIVSAMQNYMSITVEEARCI